MTGILTVGIAIVLLLLGEHFFPLRSRRRPLLPRWGVNAAFSLLTYGSAYLVVRPAILAALSISNGRFGIFPWLRLGMIPEAILSFLALDFTFYGWHRANHAFKQLWRFHNVHHIDPDLDLSTAFRFHFVEVALSSVFRFFQVLLLGVPFPIQAVFDIVFQTATFFHHSNLRLPTALESVLQNIFVTPRLHGIHHSKKENETNSNYSVIFSIWDQWLRTFTPGIPVREIQIGVPGYDKVEDNYLKNAIAHPFAPQKAYWLALFLFLCVSCSKDSPPQPKIEYQGLSLNGQNYALLGVGTLISTPLSVKGSGKIRFDSPLVDSATMMNLHFWVGDEGFLKLIVYSDKTLADGMEVTFRLRPSPEFIIAEKVFPIALIEEAFDLTLNAKKTGTLSIGNSEVTLPEGKGNYWGLELQDALLTSARPEIALF